MDLTRMTWPDVADRRFKDAVALVPIGSTEQHGPHLPLGTDHMIADALATAAADRTDSVRLPVLPIGVSSHHRHFPGTVWVDAPRFRAVIEAYSQSLAQQGLNRIVFVNAHGGNVAPLREVGRRLRDEAVAYGIEWMWDESIPDCIDEVFERPGPHAGPKETAMLLHIEPAAVDHNQLANARDEGIAEFDPADVLRHGARTDYDTVDISPNGSFGDPTEATGAIGQRLFTAATDALVSLIEWLAAEPFEALLPRQGLVTTDA